MPKDDIYRFILWLVFLIFMVTLSIRLMDWIFEIKKGKLRIEKIKVDLNLAELTRKIQSDFKEDCDDVEDDPSGK